MSILRACTVCGALSAYARCPEHNQHRLSYRPRTELRHHVLLRDGYRCTHRSKGVRCPTTIFDGQVHVDHRVPLEQGGADVVDNLRTLCAEHHRARHADH